MNVKRTDSLPRDQEVGPGNTKRAGGTEVLSLACSMA